MQLGALEYLISLNSNNLDKDIKKADNKLTSWAVAKGQMINHVLEKAMSSAGDGLKKVIGGAFSSFADYEQLVGGVDTLFKQSSKKLQQYASMAYKTVGVSANQYMEQVTSFSASLLQSLGGDTDKAADVADMAMQDMADNMNKMGSSMESIQNAYQGFAKQNYTMLDNLKLGYGGTKSEMQRLLKDAQKLTGQKYDITNLSDVYNAIHAIQQEMGITGTTSKEAEETITGSMNSAKAAWKDMLVAMGSGKNVQTATRRFADAAQTVIKNATPVISQTLNSLLLSAKTIWPSVKKAINDIWNSTRSTIKGLMPKTIRQLMNIGGTIMKRLTQAFKKDGLKGIWNETKQLFGTLKSSIAEWLKIDSPDVASWGQIGSAILDKIKEKINGETIKKLLLGDSYNSDSTWADVAENISTKLKSAFKTTFVGVLSVLGIDAEKTDDWKTIATKTVDGIKTGLSSLNEAAKLKIADLLGIETDGDTKWSEIGGEILTRLKTALSTGMSYAKLKISHLLGIEADGDTKWSAIGKTILQRLKNGISSARLKFADLLGVDDPENATWGDIGSKIAEGIGSAFTKGKSYLVKLIMGDSYDENKSEWEQVGQKISGWIEKGFGEDGFITKFLDNLFDKWDSIIDVAVTWIEKLAGWLGEEKNVKKLSGALTKIINSLAGVTTTIISDVILPLFKDQGFIDALSTLAQTLVGVVLTVLNDENVRSAAMKLASSILFGETKTEPKVEKKTASTKGAPYRNKSEIETLLETVGKPAEKQSGNLLGAGIFAKLGGIKGALVYPAVSHFMEILQRDGGIGKAIENALTKDLMGNEVGLFDALTKPQFKQKTVKEASDTALQSYIAMQDVFARVPTLKASAEIVWQNGAKLPGTNINTTAGGRGGWWIKQTKAKGDWNVPYDMIAMLHQGETVLTKSQARMYRDEGNVDAEMIVNEIRELGRNIKRMKMYVGRDAFGQVVTETSGGKMTKYIAGKQHSKLAGMGAL